MLYRRFGKRALDLLVGIPVLLLSLPVLLLTALAVRIKLGSPVLFVQDRGGIDGSTFRMYKFRSMTDARDEQGELLPDADRLTRFGRILRSSSLDELPSLLNLLKGDVSLVGPRPLTARYLDRYNSVQIRRLSVKPGITGWAQVRGRNALSWDEKFELDLWYVDHLSFWVDVKIIVMTPISVLKRDGISAEGDATMPEFMGSAETKE